MIDSLFISVTGMNAHQQQVDAIANNLANINTMGFKKERINFQDLMRSVDARQQVSAAAMHYADGKGIGSAVALPFRDFSPGDLKKTDNSFDIAIKGKGFLEFLLPDGSYTYSRHGALQIDSEGFLTSAEGYPLSAMIQIPIDARRVEISPDGIVSAQLDDTGVMQELAQLDLGYFINESGLQSLGGNLYAATMESGDVLYSRPGEQGTGALAQGYLEGANVSMVEEMTGLMMAQRAYQLNAKVLQASDEILDMVNNLRR